MRELTEAEKARRIELIETCRKFSGEYLPSHHGPGSWATTYSTQFLDAATELCKIYREAGATWLYPELSRDFRGAGIRTCRGADFSFDRAEYLLKTHIAKRLEGRIR